MPIPFEAFLPYGIMIAMFGVTGTGLAAIRTWQNEGKRPRYSLDQWDRQSKHPCGLGDPILVGDASTKGTDFLLVMQRDHRLTGTPRGQTDQAEAPLGFELTNPWKLEAKFT